MTALPSFFANPAQYPYSQGALFLGLDDLNREIGVETERHAIAIAGSGAGKGACLLIPNALRWPHNLLGVDPKGELASTTWQAREALGQTVHVLDPFKEADVPERLRASINPLASISTESPTGREDIEVIADGLVKRSDPKHAEWYDGAASMLAGLMAYVIETAPPALRTLAAMRGLLLQPNEALFEDAQRMMAATAFGGLARETGVTLMTAIESEKGMEKDFLGAARRYTKWMDSPPVAATLAASSFDLSDLKRGKASLFIVLPPQYLETHAAFLRLFVRAAINAVMAEGSGNKGARCLFLLDEFYSLGTLDIIAKSAGLMRSYGLHLWPFLQDIGQLRSLYGRDLSETFFANADAAIFFGNDDGPTLDHVSAMTGRTTPDEAAPYIPRKVDHMFAPSAEEARRAEIRYANEMTAYHHALAQKGAPRMTRDEIARLVGKPIGQKVASRMLVFIRGGNVLNLTPHPYFWGTPMPLLPPPPATWHNRGYRIAGRFVSFAAAFYLGLTATIVGFLLMYTGIVEAGTANAGLGAAFAFGLMGVGSLATLQTLSDLLNNR